MLRSSRAFLAALSLALIGGGCLGGSSSTGSTGGVFVSVDAGQNWTQSSALPSASGIGSIATADVLAFEFDPSDESALYIGTAANGLLYSLDGGASWMRPEEELLRSGKVLDIEVDPRDVCTYYVLKTDRLLKTTTCGREFDAETYVQGTSDALTDLALDWYSPNNVYLTSKSGDVLRSTDGGANWAAIHRNKDQVNTIVISNTDSRILMIGTRSHGMYRSIDSGVTWTEYEDALEDYKGSDEVYEFVQTADGKTLYMSSEYGLLSSSDAGATWNDVPLITARGEVEILSLAVDPNNGEHVVYGTSNTFYRSTTGGDAWTTEKLPTSRAASALAIHPSESSTILLGALTLED